MAEAQWRKLYLRLPGDLYARDERLLTTSEVNEELGQLSSWEVLHRSRTMIVQYNARVMIALVYLRAS